MNLKEKYKAKTGVILAMKSVFQECPRKNNIPG